MAKEKDGTFDPAEQKVLDLFPLDEPHETDQIECIEKLLRHLREWHRELSEQVITVNREMVKVVALGNLDTPELLALREQALQIRDKRAEVETEIEAETLRFKSLLQAQQSEQQIELQEKQQSGDVAQPVPSTETKKAGLVRVRHPNRDFFLADLFDYALKDDGASMEAPIFTLSTKPDLSIWQWTSKDGNKSVKVAPSVLGRATQHDKDVLIYVISQLTEALNRERDDARNRTVRFTVYDFLVTTNRRTDGESYKRLHEAFERLAGTRISTDIKTGGQRIREGFGIIDRWKIIEKTPTDERMIAVEITLSEWLYNAVSAFEVLTIHSDYFRGSAGNRAKSSNY